MDFSVNIFWVIVFFSVIVDHFESSMAILYHKNFPTCSVYKINFMRNLWHSSFRFYGFCITRQLSEHVPKLFSDSYDSYPCSARMLNVMFDRRQSHMALAKYTISHSDGKTDVQNIKLKNLEKNYYVLSTFQGFTTLIEKSLCLEKNTFLWQKNGYFLAQK